MVKIGKDSELDIEQLIRNRMLVQANSGGGKSYALRKILEETHGKVQHIVLDMEGEFNTLREKYDYLLVGKEGDIPCSIKTAELLARKILEIGVSTIIDLYELKQHERILFMKRFLDSMINAPKNLWKPCLVIIDEAHVFCPQGSKSEAMGSVIDLCTRGRKRGYCAILATQRLSKLHKDAAAECNNKLIGRTGLDVDMKRASEELGFTKKEDMLSLRTLEPGEFYTFGPALSLEVTRVTIGKVRTTHPEAGAGIKMVSPPPTNKVKGMLKQLTDLPKEAEEELKTINDLKKKIVELKRSSGKPAVNKEMMDRIFNNGRILAELKAGKEIRRLESILGRLKKVFQSYDISEDTKKTYGKSVMKLPTPPMNRTTFPSIKKEAEPVYLEDDDEITLARCEKKIYSFLHHNSNRSFTLPQVGAVTGYSYNGGNFRNSLGRLRTLGLIGDENGGIVVKRLMPELAEESVPFNIDGLKNKLAKCEKEILDVLIDSPEETISYEEIASRTPSQYAHDGGNFRNSLGRLNTLELIKKQGVGLIKLSPDILEMMGE